MELKDTYRQKMSAQLNEWANQINLFEAKLQNASDDMKAKGNKELQELRRQQKASAEKMRELNKAGGEAWNEIKGTAEKVWDDMKTGLANAQSRFK